MMRQSSANRSQHALAAVRTRLVVIAVVVGAAFVTTSFGRTKDACPLDTVETTTL